MIPIVSLLYTCFVVTQEMDIRYLQIEETIVGSLASEFLHWSCNSYVGHWNSYVGIPMSNVGIPTWVFQIQPRNSEAREPTTKLNFTLSVCTTPAT